MAVIKIIIFSGLLALALGYTLPENHIEDIDGYEVEPFQEEVPYEDSDVLVRLPRSPQGSLQGVFSHDRRMGSSAGIDYNHRIGRNFEAYGGVSRNFRFNDNAGHVGLRYRF